MTFNFPQAIEGLGTAAAAILPMRLSKRIELNKIIALVVEMMEILSN
jgi:hypothetical protein